MKNQMLKLSLLLVVGMSFTSCHDFNREQNEKDAESKGRAILLEAESSKKAKIEEAKANLESAKLDAQKKIVLAEAEIIKARAEAQSTIIRANAEKQKIGIMTNAFGSPENYLTFLKYQMMYSGKGNKYFVATEGSLPIMIK